MRAAEEGAPFPPLAALLGLAGFLDDGAVVGLVLRGVTLARTPSETNAFARLRPTTGP
jgi:hypothetical protein